VNLPDAGILDCFSEHERDVWDVLIKSSPKLAGREFSRMELYDVFKSPDQTAESIAIAFLQCAPSYHLSSDTLSTIAGETSEKFTALENKIEIDEDPGVYLFVSRGETSPDDSVWKVGQAQNIRERILRHLRTSKREYRSNLIDYCCDKFGHMTWPGILEVWQVNALWFPLKASNERSRCAIEICLQELFIPPME
jgi:hypothetical protein